MDKNNGGPAFPISIPGHGDNGACGMSLRDYLAAKAMQAALSISYRGPEISARVLAEEVAIGAYRMADAMLRAREST